MLKVGVLVSGGGTNLQAVIDAVDSGKVTNAEIVTVVASNANAFALKRAEKHGIAHMVISRKSFESQEAFDAALTEHMKACEVDLVVLAGYLTILGGGFINEFENKIINVHPSLIPSFCGDGFYGLKVHEAALKRGVKVTGATVHYVNEVTDGGSIIMQKAVYVKDGDTPETLQKRVMEEAEWDILPAAINKIANNL